MAKKRIAIFDIDGTVFRSSLLRELMEGLITFGAFPSDAHEHYVHAYVRWLDRKSSYHLYHKSLVGAYQRHVRGVHKNIVRDVANHVLDFHGHRIYHYTKKLVRQLKKQGFYLVAISGSPQDIVEPFAKNCGFNKVYGRLFTTNKDGRFTGNISNQKGIEKKDVILHRILKEEGLALEGSVGVGDTNHDISFLKLVSRPIAFNPDEKLYRYAKKNRWEIIIERKDVIYRPGK